MYSAPQPPQFLTALCTMVCCRAKSERSSLFSHRTGVLDGVSREICQKHSEEVLRPQEHNTLRLRGFTLLMQTFFMEIIVRNPTF